jgi:tetratricopeptide (TPR) repeat protein
MADVLMQMGKPNEAMALYKESLETIQALGDVRAIAVTQSKMADVLRQMGKPQRGDGTLQGIPRNHPGPRRCARNRRHAEFDGRRADADGQTQRGDGTLQGIARRPKKALGDVRAIAVTQSSMADVLMQMGKPNEAMALYKESLETIQALGDVRAIAVTQSSMADVLMQMGKPNEAMALYKESLETIQALGDVRAIAVTQSKMADVLMQMGKPNEAMALYKESLETIQALGDVRAIAVTQSSMADVLMQMGKPNEAMALYKESLETKKALGDVRAIAVTQSKMADVLMQMGKPNEAMALYKESLETKKALGDVREIAVTQSKMADVLRQMGKPNEAMALYKESLETIQALGDVRGPRATCCRWARNQESPRCTQVSNFGQFLLQQGEGRPAMEMLWAAYTTLARAGYAADAATMRHLLAAVKTQVLGAARFDAIWAEAVGGAQPDWLAATEAAPPGRYHLPPDQQAALVANTVAVLTAAPDQARAVARGHRRRGRSRWRTMAWTIWRR